MRSSPAGPSRHHRIASAAVLAAAVLSFEAALLPAGVGHVVAPSALEAQEARAGSGEAVPTLAERAREIHRRALVVDGHNDLPWRLRGEAGLSVDSLPLDTRREEGHTDLVRLREGGIDAQFWSVYVPASLAGADATEAQLEQIDLVKRLAARYPAHLAMAYTADDVVRIAATGRTASLLGAEGGHVIGNSLPVLRELHRAGVRYLTLTHSRTLAWADAAGDSARHGGLTDFGRKVVREMNRLGMLVDLSHVTAEVMHDALDVARAPVLFSHSSARALADHPRNVPDDVLRRLPGNGGVIMITFVSHYLTPEGARVDLRGDSLRAALEARGLPEDEISARMRTFRERNPVPAGTVATVADHIDHVVEVAGVDHVGVGSDWDGTSLLPRGLEDVSGLPALTEELLRRGYTETEIHGILGGNVLRVLREAEATAARLAGEPPALDRLPFRGPAPEAEGSGGSGGP